jgi:hypothetical protein
VSRQNEEIKSWEVVPLVDRSKYKLGRGIEKGRRRSGLRLQTERWVIGLS